MSGRVLIYAVVALGVVLGAAVVIGLARSDGSNAVASLDDLREQKVLFLDEHHAFLVYNDGEPLALSDDAQHVAGEHVEFCPSSQLFESPAHGEKFDIRGYYFGGPAQRGLDRYLIRIEGDGIYVDFEQLIPGPARGEGPAREPEGVFCITE